MADQLCYYCGSDVVVSREHAPARQMFKGFACYSITVPSCAQHNTSKSEADDVIVKGMLIALHQVADRYPSNAKVKTAIEIASQHFHRVKHKVTPFARCRRVRIDVIDLITGSFIPSTGGIRRRGYSHRPEGLDSGN